MNKSYFFEPIRISVWLWVVGCGCMMETLLFSMVTSKRVNQCYKRHFLLRHSASSFQLFTWWAELQPIFRIWWPEKNSIHGKNQQNWSNFLRNHFSVFKMGRANHPPNPLRNCFLKVLKWLKVAQFSSSYLQCLKHTEFSLSFFAGSSPIPFSARLSGAIKDFFTVSQ